MQPFPVTTPDGLTLAAYACGAASGAEIVFLHGFSQCHLSWRRQLQDAALAREFRMIAYDLRGHGGSDKPVGREWYRDDRLWADDLAAVIDAAGLRRPTLVAWSYAGRVVADYLRLHGEERLAGIVFVAAVTRSRSEHWGPAMKLTRQMCSDDLAVNIAATRGFVHACFATPPAADEIETMLAFTAMVPAPVRACVLDRSRNEGDLLPGLRLPVLVVHGGKDEIVLPAAGRFTAAAVPGAALSLYEEIGHAPFIEDAERFNRELAEFVRAAAARASTRERD